MESKYSLSLRVIHWLMAALIIGLAAMGLWMSGLPNDYPGKFDYYGLHKSFGVIALVFIIIRLSARFTSKIPALPNEIDRFSKLLATLVIALLYACMVLMPLSGYLMSDFGGYGVHFFGYTFPFIFTKDGNIARFFVGVHQFTSYTLIGLLILHILGWLKHLMFDKINLFRRMF